MRDGLYKAAALLFLFLFSALPVSAFDGRTAAAMIRNPVIETVLAAVILISIAAEIKTAGFSGGALAAAMAGAILIGANWYEEESFFWEFILYFGGLVLILTDILILMSGAGILCGLVLVLGGLFLTFGGGVEALYVLSFSVLAAGAGLYFLLDHLGESRLWKKLALHTELKGNQGFLSSTGDFKNLVGKQGTAVSVLRPAGKVKIDGKLVDALSDGTFTPAGKPVVVERAESSYVVVKEMVQV